MTPQTDVSKFEDLKFIEHPVNHFDHIAQCEFPNGYGLSAVDGECAYCTEGNYEVGILHNGELTYNTPLTDDVLADVSPERINELIATVKSWEKDQY